eukprot:9461985-Pyramimonas_sp.AAC.2
MKQRCPTWSTTTTVTSVHIVPVTTPTLMAAVVDISGPLAGPVVSEPEQTSATVSEQASSNPSNYRLEFAAPGAESTPLR